MYMYFANSISLLKLYEMINLIYGLSSYRLRRYLDNNQIAELPRGVFSYNTKLIRL